MYSPREQFVNIAKHDLNAFPVMRYKKFLPRFTLALGIGLSGGQELYPQRFIQVILMQIVCIAAVSVYPAAFRQIKAQVAHSLAVMHMPWGDGEFDGNTIHRSDYLHGEAIEVLPFRGLIAPVFEPSNQPGTLDADVVAHANGKAVHGILRFDVQALNCSGQLAKRFHHQITSPMDPTIKPTLTQHIRNKPGPSDEAQRALEVTTKIHASDQHRGDDLRIAYSAIFGLFMPLKFENIVEKNVNCHCFFYHNPSGFKVSTKPKSEGFLSIANFQALIYQQCKELFNSFINYYR